MSILLSAQGLAFTYHQHTEHAPGIKQADATIARGEFVAICGPSGSGKSTLLYLLSGLLAPQHGQVILDGLDLNNLNAGQRAYVRAHKIAFIFQHFYLLPRLTVRQNLQLMQRYRQQSDPMLDSKIQNYANKFNLQDKLDYCPPQLSGGEQQRVAIIRALLQEPDILFADEPTGNLDSKTAQAIVDTLRKLQQEKQLSLVLVTHDPALAQQADRVIHVQDGHVSCTNTASTSAQITPQAIPAMRTRFMNTCQHALQNILFNKRRVLLTLLGIIIGVATIFATITAANYTKQRMIASYRGMGVDRFGINGSPNWMLRVQDVQGFAFEEFSVENDLQPLTRVFPHIKRWSPQIYSLVEAIKFSGKELKGRGLLMGVNQDYLPIAQHGLQLGDNFSAYQIEQRQPFCIIGQGIKQQLFSRVSPLAQYLSFQVDQTQINCQVIGVLNTIEKTPDQQVDVNNMILMPYTYLQITLTNFWNKRISHFIAQTDEQVDVRKLSAAVTHYFANKYGNTGIFVADTNALLLAQMQQFILLFSITLLVIASITLLCGCISIVNMMLVIINERLYEIGIRQILGATPKTIFYELLSEAFMICCFGGTVGLLAGFACYEAMIYVASHFLPQLKFTWLFNPIAFVVSLLMIVGTGILSGLFPAYKGQHVNIIDCLRNK